MRTFFASSLVSLISVGAIGCSSDVGERVVGESPLSTSPAAGSANALGTPTSTGNAGATTTAPTSAGAASAADALDTTNTSTAGANTAGTSSATTNTAGANTTPDSSSAGASNDTTTPTGNAGAGTDNQTDPDPTPNAGAGMIGMMMPGAAGMANTAGMTTQPPANNNPPAAECTDTPPDDRETCATWAEWGECGADWLAGFCEASCGVCEGGASDPNTGNDPNAGNDPDPTPDPDPDPNNGQNSSNLGDDNPYQPINGGQQGNSTRYWDCCKQSCGWSANASNPVDSCDYNGNNIGVNDQDRNVCDPQMPNGSPGTATTCHGMAPWAYSTQVSYGYAAANGAGCGTCWQLQFTGTANSGQQEEGAGRLKGKTMVVMATNIGDLNGNLHFDLLIPGGGLGQNNGCTTSLGIPVDQLGENRGGFLTTCARQTQDYNARKQCVRDMCQSVFGSRGLSDLESGCTWFADWFEAADNPDFLVQQVDCPQELRQFN